MSFVHNTEIQTAQIYLIQLQESTHKQVVGWMCCDRVCHIISTISGQYQVDIDRDQLLDLIKPEKIYIENSCSQI